MAGLYIHIPFCHSKCGYCDFYSIPMVQDIAQRYVDQLLLELQARRHEVTPSLSTVYIGGGTPSILPLPQLQRLIVAIGKCFDLSTLSEFTIEANPEDVTESWLSTLKGLGVGRISMGVQSLDDHLLNIMRRRHSAIEALRAMELIASQNFDLSVDLIYGLPSQSPSQWHHSLSTVLDMRPEHLSAYLLSYEPGTLFHAMLSKGRLTEASEADVVTMYTDLCQSAHSAGYLHYEISNFSLPGHEAIHNSNYWLFSPYLGVGPGAHSFDGSIRRVNPNKLRLYMEANFALSPFYLVEEESTANRLNEFIMVGLRTRQGIDLNDLLTLFGQQAADMVMSQAAPHLANGKMTLSHHHLSICEEAWLISNSIILDFISID